MKNVSHPTLNDEEPFRSALNVEPLRDANKYWRKRGHRSQKIQNHDEAITIARQMHLLSATALLDDGVTLTRTCRQVIDQKERQVVKNMHGTVHGLKLRLALKKTVTGRISKGFDFLGYRRYGFGALGLTGLAQQTIDNHQQKLLRLDEPSASDQRVEKYVSNRLRANPHTAA